MITELTPEQESMIEVYEEKYTKISRRTTRINKDKAIKAVEFLYTEILEQAIPNEIVFLPSPLACINEINKRNSTSGFVSEDRSNLWIAYYCMYDYILNELLPEHKEEFALLGDFLESMKECHKFYMYDNACFISDFPIVININSDDDLHSTNEASIEYSDGFALHSLNGITVSKEIALCKPEDITKDMILKEVNADIRREIVRKLSPEQLITVLTPNVIDTDMGYELLEIDIGDNRKRPFLKMSNPSLDLIHVEGVHPSCKTVREAIAWRNGLDNFSSPEIIS